MPTPIVSSTVCAICGEPLQGRPDCLVCLVRGGLGETSDGAESRDPLVFGDFEIERRADGSLWELGHGAMGVTYRATDRVLRRSVALKVIDLPAAAGGALAGQERFLREARAAAALRHPNVAGVFQFGASSEINRCYYAMELIEGETLEELVRREGPLKVGASLEIAIQVTHALIAAAAHGLIHRDLKPANIMLAPNESGSAGLEAKVIDFGLAKATTDAAGERDLTHGGFVGTPTFASPEQLGSAPVDARSDIYSLGVTLWYALTGEIPCPGKTIEEIRKAQTELPLPLEQLRARRTPAAVIRLLRATLAVDPGRRPAAPRELLVALESCRNQLSVPNESGFRRASRWVAILCALAAILAGAFFTFQELRPGTALPTPPEEKSIAVLPFKNLSDDRENEYFADGIQDDILTSLAKISDLKVISRTSASQYRGTGAARNLRSVARELGVENILEGSVRREGDRVLLNVQLIEARNDRHIWAERYDRTGSDSIGLQGELATQIAAALKAKLAPDEKARLSAKPTKNPAAYALYLKALGREQAVNRSTEDLTAAEQLYAQAVTLDPGFALAHARISIVNSKLAVTSTDDDRVPRQKARAAAEEALRLSPALGEAHMARGLYLYLGDKDYTAALQEFSVAAATSPNEPDILTYIAGIYRRQGRWRESLATYQRAQDLDPRSVKVITLAATDYLLVRDWPAGTACYNRALEIAPDSADARIGLAYLEVFRNSNPAAGRRILQNIPAGIDPDGWVTLAQWEFAMLERDYATAAKILADFPLEDFPRAGDAPKTFYQGRTALARGEIESAQRYFAATLSAIEGWVGESPNDAHRHATLGLLYAYLGRKEDAIREGRRAVELEPESQNAFHGADAEARLALIYARTGESNQAIALIERLLSTPGPVGWPDFSENITLADLRLRWEWDPLRGDPRFEKILAAPEPKTVY